MSNQEEMRMEDFESLLEESLKQPTRGSTVKGTITQIQGNDVIVNISTKTEGVVDKSELGEDVKVGDSLDFVVVGINMGDYIQLSKRMINERSEWSELKNSPDKVVKVKVESHSERGYHGKVGEVRVFIPNNHIDLRSKAKDPNEYVGQTLDAKVLKFSNNGRFKSALVSPKECILDRLHGERKEFFENIKVNDELTGTVKTLKEYGAFISFGAVDGFLHKSNITWGRPRNPSRYLEEGAEVTTIILDVNVEESKIEVGMKQLTEDPWELTPSKYPLESIVNATVIGRRRNGYIAEIESGVDAFIPLDELTWLKNIRKTLNPKDQIEGKVLEYDQEHKRVIISMRLMKENPWVDLKTDKPEGTVVEATIKNITDFGIFVDFGSFVDGLIRKGDISWSEEPNDLNEQYKVGDKVEAKILRIDDARERVSLGIKQIDPNPWRDIPRGGARQIEVTVTAVTKSGLEVELESGLKGLIHINELDPEKPSLDAYKVGDTLMAGIIRADQRDQTLNLSVKRMISETQKKEAKEYMKKLEKSEETQGFGNIFKDMFNDQ